MAERECRCAGIGCADCKKILVENINSHLAPIQKKYHEIKDRPDYLYDILKAGSAKASVVAQATMAEVREKAGLLPLT